jgi:hypothetical protein
MIILTTDQAMLMFAEWFCGISSPLFWNGNGEDGVQDQFCWIIIIMFSGFSSSNLCFRFVFSAAVYPRFH